MELKSFDLCQVNTEFEAHTHKTPTVFMCLCFVGVDKTRKPFMR